MTKRKISKGITKCGGNIPVVASIIVLVAFIAGLLLGSLVIVKAVGGKSALFSQMTGSFADGYNAAKKIINDSGLFPHLVGTLSGQITGVSGNEVTINAPLINPLDDQSLKARTAVATKDTVITLYKLKSSTQIAADQKTGQQEMADAQKQMSSLQAQIAKCGPVMPVAASSSNITSGCNQATKDYSAALQQLNQASQLMDIYVKSDNASLSDLKVGMQITVYGELTAPAANQTVAPLPGASNFADISEQAKFNVSQIVAREAQTVPTALGIPSPAAPAPVSSTSAQ